MSAAAPRSAELLDRIATALGVPVSTFTAPASVPLAGIPSDTPSFPLWLDANGRRLAVAFTRLPPHARKALADGAEALCAGYAVDLPPSAEGRR